MEALADFLEPLKGLLGVIWVILGAAGCIWGSLGALLEPLGRVLGGSCKYFRRVWGVFWRDLGAWTDMKTDG